MTYIQRSLNLLLLFTAISVATSVSAQPAISYLLPDIGSPGMNTYVEIVGPYNKTNNFGNDGVSLNNSTDTLRVVCANPSDTQYVRIGPCIASWNGRLISTQIFVLPWIKPPSSDWEKSIAIPLKVFVKNQESNTDTFYIVKPQSLGTNGVLNTAGNLGSGGTYGKRSRRGAMIVDSLFLGGNGVFHFSATDCDIATPGNQSFLPAVIIGKGPISIANQTELSVSASGTNAGPGGGGGGGDFDEVDPEINNIPGGDGFTGGQGGHSPGGSGSGNPAAFGGNGGSSLNGVPGGFDISGKGGGEGTGGGTGFCFGLSGTGGFSQDGGYGGGSGAPQDELTFVGFGGGGGGFATAGTTKQGGAGNVYGNKELIPFMGGSGGAGGNPFWSQPGLGGGGGGCISIYSQRSVNLARLTSIGADGLDDTASYHNPPGNAGSGGAGSGGAVIAGAKAPSSVRIVDVHGGTGGSTKNPAADSAEADWQNGGDGGLGRVRIDGPIPPQIPQVTGAGSTFNGITTGVFDTVPRTFILSGTGTTNLIQLYIRPLSGNWIALPVLPGKANWSTSVTLPGSDTLFFLAASQRVTSSSSTSYTADPSWMLSQAGANILYIKCNEAALGALPATVDFGTISACTEIYDTIIVANNGCSGATLTESIDNTGLGLSIFKHLSSSLKEHASDTIILKLKPSSSGPFSTTLHIKYQNGDLSIPVTGDAIVNITALPGNTITYDPIAVCDTTSRQITIANFSCDSITIIQVTPPSADFISPTGLTGKKIHADDSLTITILEDPSGPGSKSDSMIVKVRTASGVEQLLTIYLKATVLPKRRVMSFDELVRVDSLPPCTPFDTVLVIRNLGICDTLILGSVTSSGFTLLNASSSDIGRRIGPGETFNVSVHITPSTSMDGTATIHLLGNGFDSIITITTTSRTGGKPFTLSVTDSLFSTTACNTATRVFTFKNASCNPIVIDGLLLTGSSQFTFTPKPGASITIQPGDSTKIIVQFDPTATGDSLATFSYHSGTFSGQVKLRGTATGSRQYARLTLALSAGSLPVQRAGSTVSIDLIWQDPLSAGIGLTAVGATLNYGDNILTPKLSDITVIGGWTISCANPSTGRLDLCLSKSDASAIAPGTVLATIPFFATISDVDRTTVTLPGASFNNGDSTFAICVLSPLASASIDFKIDSECSLPTLKHFLATGKIFDKIVVIPNPSTRGEKEVLISLSLNQASKVELSLSDILGRTIYEQRNDESQTGLKEYRLPLSETSNGTYIIRVSAAGETASIPLSIRR